MMSRSSSRRRPATSSRGSSSYGHRSLSVTEALQNIRFTETVNDHIELPPSYVDRRRVAQRDETIQHGRTADPPTSYAPYTLNPAVLSSSGNYEQPPYSPQPSSTSTFYQSTSETMRYRASRLVALYNLLTLSLQLSSILSSPVEQSIPADQLFQIAVTLW